MLPTDTYALTQNSWTWIGDRNRYTQHRKFLDINEYGAIGDVRIFLGPNPWALSCDGGDHVTIDGLATHTALIESTRGDIVATIKHANTAAIRNIVSLADTSANEYVCLSLTAAHLLTATLRTAAAVQWTVTTNAAIAPHTWHAVKLYHDGVKPTLFVNGNAPAQTFSVFADKTAWFADLSNLDNARLASLNTAGAGEANQFTGFIGGLSIHTADANGARTKVCEFAIDEGTGTSLTDNSGNSLTGTFGAATAAPTWSYRAYGKYIPAGGGYTFPPGSDPSGKIWAFTATLSVNVTVSETY